MTDWHAPLARLNRIAGVRGSMIVAAEDGLVVEADLMVGLEGAAVAALIAACFARGRRALEAAQLGRVLFLQLEAERGTVYAAAPAIGELLLAVITDPRVNVGVLRLEAAALAEALP